MRDLIEAQYQCEVRQWGEPQDDLDTALYSAVQSGRLIVAESLALLISALQERIQRPLLLCAA